MKVRLCDVFDLQMGKTPSRNHPEYWNGEHKWVSIGDLGDVNKYIFHTKECISDAGVTESGIKPVPAGTVIMSFKLSIGKTAITKENIYTNEAIMAFIDKKVRPIDIHYIYYLFSGIDWSEGSNKAVKGVTLNKATLSQKVIDLPDLKTQRIAVAILDKLSNLISLRKQQLAKLDELVKARFIELFSNVKSEDALINLCTFIDYRGKTPEKANSGLPFITAKNVKMHYMSFDTQEFISKETYDKVMTRGFPRMGDVVFTTEAPLGNVCRIPCIDTEFYIGQRIITMQTDCLEPAYLEYALDSDEFRRKIAEKSSGSTVTGIRSKLLEQLTIPIPPIGHQQQFAAFVCQSDKSKLTIQQSLDKLELLKRALMQKYFQ